MDGAERSPEGEVAVWGDRIKASADSPRSIRAR